MTSRTHKRKHSSWLSFLSAHRLKATLASIVTLLGFAASAGLVDTSKLPPWVTQIIPQIDAITGMKLTSPANPPVAVAAGSTRSTCFTPGQDCTSLIVHEIDGAKTELLVQAYGFTAPPIIDAIARAKDRGVKVQVILDKTNESEESSGASTLVLHGITPQIDDHVAIAHNKVMVIDQQSVITGSFNFTDAAQSKNAENVLVITGDTGLAAQYRQNWETRLAASRPYVGFVPPVL